MRVGGDTLKWIQSFLSTRTQQVLVEGSKSSKLDVLSGVPQGTVLGPLLFLVYINDLPDVVTCSDTRLFADDSPLYRHIRDNQDVKKLQTDLSSLETHESQWQMSFHPEKMHCPSHFYNQTDYQYNIKSCYFLHGHKL